MAGAFDKALRFSKAMMSHMNRFAIGSEKNCLIFHAIVCRRVDFRLMEDVYLRAGKDGQRTLFVLMNCNDINLLSFLICQQKI